MRTLAQVVATDFAMLAALHDREPDVGLLSSMRETGFPDGLGLSLLGETGQQAVDLMRRVLVNLPQQPDERTLDELAADYASIYLNYGIHASPQESVWVDEESLACQDSMFQVRSWYEQYGLSAENWRVRPDDHLVLQLQFLNHLFSRCADLSCLGEVARFMDEHLLRWLMPFAERVAARCDTAYFAAVTLLTGAYCEELRDLLAQILDKPRPSVEEIDERMKPRHQTEAVPVSFVPGVGPAV
ncbi:MAG: molecular chaperone TorD family protein [Gammaproteobacteria bacterium]|nr:molecular chaperone TorD family protein [Gammaproteobacteria bacterium]